MAKELSLNILELARKVQKLEEAGGGGSADSAKKADIATEFNETTAYTAGCFVYHEGKLYQFNADHAAGAWDPTDVVEANVTDQVVSNTSAISALDGDLDEVTSAIMATPIIAQKNADYVGDNWLSVLKVGHMVVVSGRFQVINEKPATQSYVLFSQLPIAADSAVVPIFNSANVSLIINGGYITSNDAIPAGFYNVQAAYAERVN